MSTSDVVAAVGIMSSMGASGQASAAQYRSRRRYVRESFANFPNVGQSIHVRFLIATPSAQEAAIQGSDSWQTEVRLHGDFVFLAMNESRFSCALKPLLWYEHCLKHFASAHFFAIADDDTYLQLGHMESDIRSLRDGAAERLVMWGLVMWYGAYDNVTMVTHETWGGWSYADGGAVKMRRRMDRCRQFAAKYHTLDGRDAASAPRATRRRGHSGAPDPCSRLTPAGRATIVRDGLSDQVPWPIVNGPLFAVSNRLARLLVNDPLPRKYVSDLHQTSRVKMALNRPGGPRKSNFGCWPVGDTIFGLWVSQLSERDGLPVELVNTPFMVQHHPWPATVHGAFGNSSIVLHGLKKERNQLKFRSVAASRGLGPFVPFRRKCGGCADMGWSTWPNSVHARSWTCCGCDATASKRDCDMRMALQ